MNLQESIRRILREETEPGIFVEFMESILQHLKEEDCICDIKISFDVEENYYNIYLVFSQEELHDKFSNVMWIRNYITEMTNNVKNDLEAFIPIRNIFIGYYTKPNCGWSPLNESEDDELTNRILDKISNYGIESLSKSERKYLDNKSQDIEDDEVSDIASIDTGYQFRDIIDDYDVRFIYNETEEWDDDPVEYKHTGEFFIDGEEYYATMYTDEDLNVHSFDLHDGNDYVEFDEELEESLLEFFQEVGDKIKQNII